MTNFPALEFIAVEVALEVDRAVEIANRHQQQFRNIYEAYGVLAKEMHELLGDISGPADKRDMDDARKQLVGIAAVAIKALQSSLF